MAKRKSKTITNREDIAELCGYARKELSASKIMELFGDFGDGPRFNPYDIITIPVHGYGDDEIYNTNEFTTTVGTLIFNKIFIEPRHNLLREIGWHEGTVTKKGYGKLYDSLGYLRLENKIELDDYKYFCNQTQAIMPFVSILSNGFTDDMLVSGKKIGALKAKLIKENKAAIDAGDIKVVDKIQKELLDYAHELLKDDPAMDMYDSGSMGSFDNNFKNMFVMKGANKDPDPAKPYTVITSNYIDGVSADEYSKLANTLAEGPYSRGKKTESGGYWEKLFLYAFQHIRLGDPGTDCGTKRALTIKITNDNISKLMYNYVVEGDKLVEITSENKDKYIGKTVKMRFSSLCEAKGCICSKCAGSIWYRLGLNQQIGPMLPQIPAKVKVIMMKAFHNNQVRLVEMDPMKAFGLDE